MLVSWEAARLRFGSDSLSCLYLVVEGEEEFLASWHGCGDLTAWDWTAVGRPPVAVVGMELRHECGHPATLRVAFEVERHREALEVLAATESLVVADRPWGRGGRAAAYAVDGAAVVAAVAAARSGLRRLTSIAN